MGAALIGYVAGEVIVSDPAVQPWVDANAHWLHFVAPLLCAALVVDCGKFFAPAHVHEPHDATEAAAGVAVFGVRALLVLIGEMVLIRAPLIVSFVVGLAGYVAVDGLTSSSEGAVATQGIMHTVGPFLGAGIALLIAEVIGRFVRPNSRQGA